MNAITKNLIAESEFTTIDRLGTLRAEIASLKKLEEKLVEEIKAQGAGKYDGAIFSATVSEVAPRQTPDPKAMEEKLRALGVSHQWFSSHQKTVSGFTAVRISARK